MPVPRSTATYYCFVSMIIARVMLSLLSTIMTNDHDLSHYYPLTCFFQYVFSMALFYIYLHMTFSRFIDKSVKGQGIPQRSVLSIFSLVIYYQKYIHHSLVIMNLFDSIFSNTQFENVPIPHLTRSTMTLALSENVMSI